MRLYHFLVTLFRKCFQVLIVKTENDGNGKSIRNAKDFLITDEQYASFIERHKGQKSLVEEPNSVMKSSYLILDEYMRFLDKGDDDKYIESESILKVDVETALSQINWDVDSFQTRNGVHDWTNEFSRPECASHDANLDW